MRVVHPRLGFTSGVKLLAQRVAVAFRPTQDRIDESRFGFAGMRPDQRDRFINCGVRGRSQKEELIEAEPEGIGNDRARRFGRELSEQEFERKPSSQAAIEQFGGKGTVGMAQRGLGQRAIEKLVGQQA
jgi:hypothetical protein